MLLLTFQSRKEMMDKTAEACDKLTGDLKGKMYRLESMSKEENQQLIDDHFLFKNDDR